MSDREELIEVINGLERQLEERDKRIAELEQLARDAKPFAEYWTNSSWTKDWLSRAAKALENK